MAAAALAWVLPGQAAAHAVLQHTTPHQDSAVSSAPTGVRLDFNEPVEVAFGAVRVYDQRGARVDTATVEHPNARQSSVSVGLRGGLGRGVYTATYRVVSADGHPVAGGFAFGIGEQVSAHRDSPQVADLLARTSAGPAVEGAYGIVRGLHYAALLLLIGATFFRLLVWPARSSARWPGRVLLVAAVVGLLSALTAIALQGALGAGVAIGHALDSRELQGSLGTRAGHAWLLRSATWALLIAILTLYRNRQSRWTILALALPTAMLVATLPFAGHAATQSPRALLIPADILHVLAAGAWLGGLVLLLVTFWPRNQHAVGDGAVEATARFSRLALPAILVLASTGSAQAWFYLGSVSALTNNTYGLALVAKTALLGLIVVLAAANRRRTTRMVSGDLGAAPQLRRSMRAEALLAALILAATATLVRAQPPAAIANAPMVRELNLGPMRLQLDVEPATIGPNDYHLYLFNRRTGAQIDHVQQLTVKLVQRGKHIGPITLAIPRKGPAHYELRNSTIGVSGTWDATVTARVSEFDEYTATTHLDIRPK